MTPLVKIKSRVSPLVTESPDSLLRHPQVKVSIKGRVQGVCFRDWTVQNAHHLGLNGWVRNRRDGSVEAVFSGEPDKVDEMVDRRCRVRPPAAMVTALNSLPEDRTPEPGFQFLPTL